MKTRTRVTAIPALLAAGATLAMPRAIFARQASPEAAANPYADLDLPEITLEFTPDSISGMPESLEANRYLVTIHGEAGVGFGTMFLRLPEGMAMEEAFAQAGASPDGPPAFYYDATLAGGPTVMAQSGATSAVAVIDLPPGDWFVAGGALEQPPVPFTVTGEMPTDLPEPKSTVTITLDEMSITFSDGELVAGQNLLRIENVGDQPHFTEIELLPPGTTRETIENTLEWEMTGTPPADVLDFSQVRFVATSGDQSGGTTMWMPAELEPGLYGIFCFIPDSESGMPHGFMGMWDLFEISE